MTHDERMAALKAHSARGNRSLRDIKLEKSLFRSLNRLQILIDSIGPTALRHDLDEQLVDMRATIWNFEQDKSI